METQIKIYYYKETDVCPNCKKGKLKLKTIDNTSIGIANEEYLRCDNCLEDFTEKITNNSLNELIEFLVLKIDSKDKAKSVIRNIQMEYGLNKKDITINNYEETIKKLKDELEMTYRLQAIKINALNLEREKILQGLNNLGLNKGDYIFIEYLKTEKEKKAYQNYGFVLRETLNHIKFIIHDLKRNAAHSYIVNKQYIRGIKCYDGVPENYISFEELLKMRKNK